MHTIESLAATLKAMTLVERQRVAELSGVPVSTLQKIAIAQTQNPRFRTVAALDAALQRVSR